MMSYVDPHKVLLRLSHRDQAVLDDIERFRLLSTRQLQRLHFTVGEGSHATIVGATKQTMRVLLRLKRDGVVDHLVRRIGGTRHGSQSYIWQLTSTGASVQRVRHGHLRRRRYVEPNSQFTDHTLAVADLAVELRELQHRGKLEISELQSEPGNWREYFNALGVPQTLKPDLYSVTLTPSTEDHAFIEMDLGTEHGPQLLAKCRAYAAYYDTQEEQTARGVFPLVLWVARDEARARQIRRVIASDSALPAFLFSVVTTAEFAAQFLEPEDSS